MIPDVAPLVDDCIEGNWPRTVAGRLIEPASGVVRIRRPGGPIIELASADFRELAHAERHPVRKQCLFDALAEAERQRETLLDLSNPSPSGAAAGLPSPAISGVDEADSSTDAPGGEAFGGAPA